MSSNHMQGPQLPLWPQSWRLHLSLNRSMRHGNRESVLIDMLHGASDVQPQPQDHPDPHTYVLSPVHTSSSTRSTSTSTSTLRSYIHESVVAIYGNLFGDTNSAGSFVTRSDDDDRPHPHPEPYNAQYAHCPLRTGTITISAMVQCWPNGPDPVAVSTVSTTQMAT